MKHKSKHCYRTLWARDRTHHLAGVFIYPETGKPLLEALYNLLKDSSVHKGLSDLPNEREWVVKVTSEESPNWALYGKVALVMARRWLDCDEKDVWKPAFLWLRGWRVSMRGGGEAKYSDPVSVELITDVEKWAHEQLAEEGDAGRWHLRVAETLREYERYEDAAKNKREAIALRPEEWKLQVGLAEALGLSTQYDEAVESLRSLIESKRALLDADETFTKLYWDCPLHDLGEWHSKRKDYDAARVAYQAILDHGFQEKDPPAFLHKAVVSMISVMDYQGQSADTIRLLDQMSERMDSDSHTWAAKLFKEYSTNNDFHRSLYLVGTRNLMDAIVRNYEYVLGSALVQQTARIRMEILWHFGNLQYAAASMTARDAAIETWCQIVF
ncbi:hypothetical protein LTR37_004857 [Vermiconidia calcicola]|uniref:Uncharacterized protein n=1 Tax=Vermiconidia calcicola TaxID=1690605 RepID=A0ACC3NKF9_9PEZI|nr:hypothetical protein LTR37_004857 [Vermiconidia calcicola]